MSNALRWGLVSTGRIARTLAAAVAASTTGKLVAVASRTLSKAQAFAKEFGAERAFGSYAELFECPEVDAVYIATPHPSHARLCVEAARAKKHILCEKPMAMNYGEAMVAAREARKNDVLLMEAFMYRSHPQTARVLELVRSGAIGKVRAIAASFSFKAPFKREARLWNPELGGGGILDIGCYPVSFARMVAGAALGGESADPDVVEATGVLNVETQVDELAVAVLRFPGEIVAHLSCGIVVAQDNRAHVFGSEGSIEIPQPWQPGREGGNSEIILRRGGSEERLEIQADKPLYTYEVDDFAAFVAARQARFPALTLSDSLGNARTLDRFRQAVGVRYPSEGFERPVETVSGRPLVKPARSSMPYGKLAGIELPVSRLVLGSEFARDLPHAAALFDAFFEAGGNAFDTAWLYGQGRCDRQLGHWVKSHGLRKDVVIVAKGAHTPFCTPSFARAHLRETLERLQTDYVDVFLLHRDNLEVPLGEFVDALSEEVAAGRARAIGVSNWTLERVDEANAYARKHGRVPFAALSNQFSLARMIEAPWAGCLSCSAPAFRAWLAENQLPVLAWSSQGRGFFSDRAGPDKRDSELVRCWYSDDNFERRRRAYELADKLGVSPTSIAGAYALAQPFPTFALIGPRTLDELDSSLEALGVALTAEQVAWLEASSSV